MSDNIPFELQVEIIKRLPVKSLLRFRSVSKPWKSLIDSSDFITHYTSQQQHLLVSYNDPDSDTYKQKYVSIADDDTFPQHKASLTLPPWLINNYEIIGCSHGLLCVYNLFPMDRAKMAVFWNISIRKAVAFVVPIMKNEIMRRTAVGFGVCRETTDPKMVKISYIDSTNSSMDWQVEVFTLSTRAWRRPHCDLPRKFIRFYGSNEGVVVDGVLYWLACDFLGISREYFIISFDLTSEEFREINLPDSLVDSKSYQNLSLCKRGESLVVLGRGVEATNLCVWIMEDGDSKLFTKLFTINVNMPYASVMGFRKSGEAIIEHHEDGRKKVVVYEPYSKRIAGVVIDRVSHSLFMYPYMESLLLNQPNFSVRNQTETLKFEDDLLLQPDFRLPI